MRRMFMTSLCLLLVQIELDLISIKSDLIHFQLLDLKIKLIFLPRNNI